MVEKSINQAANIFKLLGHETRLTTLKLLETSELCVCELVEVFQMSQPAISQHLRRLRDLGLIKEEKKGQWTYYQLDQTSEAYPFISEILKLLPDQTERIANIKRRTHC